MAPTSTRPVLKSLDPVTVAREVVTAVRDHVGLLVFGISPVYSWRETDSGDGPENTDLGLTVADLTRYAQSGDLSDWGDPEASHDAALSVCSALYSQAGHESAPVDLADEALTDTAIGLVLVAALARATLDGAPLPGRPADSVTLTELAALGSLSLQRLYQLSSAGDLPGAEESKSKSGAAIRMPRAAARRWLARREVPGF